MLFEKNTYTLVFHNHDHSVYLPYGIIVLRSSCYMPWGRRPPGSVEWFVWALGGLKALNFFNDGWTNSADFTDFTLQAIFFDLAFDTLCTPFTHEIIAIYVHHVHDRLIPAYKRYMWHAHTHTIHDAHYTHHTQYTCAGKHSEHLQDISARALPLAVSMWGFNQSSMAGRLNFNPSYFSPFHFWSFMSSFLCFAQYFSNLPPLSPMRLFQDFGSISPEPSQRISSPWLPGLWRCPLAQEIRFLQDQSHDVWIIATKETNLIGGDRYFSNY